MSTLTITRSVPFLFLVFVTIGCENQQPIIDALKKEKATIEETMAQAADKAKQMVADNAELQAGLATAEKAAEEAKGAAEKVMAAAKMQAEEAMNAAKNAGKAAAEALAEAKKDAAEAIAKAQASAAEEAKTKIAAAEANAADLQIQLDAANAKIGELEAAAKEKGESDGEG